MLAGLRGRWEGESETVDSCTIVTRTRKTLNDRTRMCHRITTVNFSGYSLFAGTDPALSGDLRAGNGLGKARPRAAWYIFSSPKQSVDRLVTVLMEETFTIVKSTSHNTLLSHRLLCVALCLCATCGCSITRSKSVWRQPTFAVPDADSLSNLSLVAAEDSYAAAVQLEADGCPDCVDLYYDVAIRAWPVLESQLATAGKTSPRVADLHRSAVAKLLITGQRFGRWNPCHGLTISTSSGLTVLPTSFQGFTWGPEEFQYLKPAGDYDAPNLSRAFRNSGLGVPLVVVRHVANPQPFTQNEQTFAATALLRFDAAKSGYQLEFYDPLRASTVDVAGCQVPLARDLTAPFALASEGEDRQWLDDFLRPGATGARDGLFMIEPYQPGKIPAIFVHGLLSDPETWADLANELRAHPDLNDRYQWWAFQYATGEPFLTSAAVLRRQLVQIRRTYDPMRQDPALSQMVLIGHSMGGLVAKLQVTDSGDRLWRSVARQRLASVHTSVETQRHLQEAFFFQPSIDVTRVVFIGTPHRGSAWARRPVGRLGSMLVEPSADSEARHSQLVSNNPELFRDELRNRFPTSVDLLEPESPLLGATATLPFSSFVALHSIIGQGQATWSGEPSDGVVPVASARLLGIASETTVDAKHEVLHRDPATVAEVVRILREHLRQNAVF